MWTLMLFGSADVQCPNDPRKKMGYICARNPVMVAVYKIQDYTLSMDFKDLCCHEDKALVLHNVYVKNGIWQQCIKENAI